jgi:hypothetical protein
MGISEHGSAFSTLSSEDSECLVKRPAQDSIRPDTNRPVRAASSPVASASKWIESRPPIDVVVWLMGKIGDGAGRLDRRLAVRDAPVALVSARRPGAAEII